MVCFGDRHPTPERTGIGSIPMKLHHPVEEFAHGHRLLVEAQKVPEVAARFLDDPRVVVVLGPFVTGDHGARFQRFKFVEGSDPFGPRLRIAFRHIRMDAVVRDVPGHHQVDGRDVGSWPGKREFQKLLK